MSEDEKLSSLMREVKTPGSPEHVDRAILELAADSAPAYRRPAWLPLASAASVVGLAVLVYFQAGTPPQPNEAVIQVEAEALLDESQDISLRQRDLDEYRLESGKAEVGVTAADEVTSDKPSHKLLKSEPDMSPEARRDEPLRSAAEPEAEFMASAPAAAATNSAREQISAESDDQTIPPAQWLENIVALWKAGDVQRASSQYHMFRQLYPGFEPDPELVATLAAIASADKRRR